MQKKVADCCNTLFNPIWLKGKENDFPFVAAKLPLLDDSGYSDVKGNFRNKINAEISRIIERVNNPQTFNWE